MVLHRRRGSEGRGEQRGEAVNIKAFFVDALTSALELGIGVPADVVRHVTPDVLANHLPRPLWARLLTACLGAPRVDATLIVETIGVPNLCEHIPTSIIWSCIADIGARSIGTAPSASAAIVVGTSERAVLAPPPDERPAPPVAAPAPIAVGPSIPSPALAATPTGPESLADVINELDQADPGEPRLATLRPRSPTAARFRQSNTSVGRLGSARRPQAAAPVTASSATAASGRSRRGETEVEPDETRVGADNGHHGLNGSNIADDSQLVDWQATDGGGSAAITDDDFSDLGRKR